MNYKKSTAGMFETTKHACIGSHGRLHSQSFKMHAAATPFSGPGWEVFFFVLKQTFMISKVLSIYSILSHSFLVYASTSHKYKYGIGDV